MINVKEYLEEAKKDLVKYLYETEKEIVEGFVEYGLENISSFDDAAWDYSAGNTDCKKEYVLKWLSERYYDILQECNEVVREEYIDMKHFSLERLFEACQRLENVEIINKKKDEIVHYHKIKFLLEYDYEEIDDDIYDEFMWRTDDEHLDFWSLEEVLNEVLEEMQDDDMEDDEGEE